MRLNRTRLPHTGVLAVAVCLLLLSLALAQAPAPKQQGLPPELVIQPPPDLEQQAEELRAILQRAHADKPAGGGGLLSGLKSLFSNKPQKIVIAATDLWEGAEALRGSQIEVHGVLVPNGKSLAFATQDGNIAIDLGGGAQPSGFPRKDLAWLPGRVTGLVEMPFDEPVLRAIGLEPSAALASLRLARVLEEQGKYREALDQYVHSANELRRAQLPWAAFAATQSGWIAYHRLRDPRLANNHLYNAWTLYGVTDKKGKPLFHTWVQSIDGSGWKQTTVPEAVGPLLDTVGRESFWYRLVDFFVILGGGSTALGIVLLALATRLGIHPLTRKQLVSMEAMRKLQPQIKALQEEFADDKQRFQQEMWKLWQENGVNPFGGCWPMLIQMPILIFVYQGIRRYIVRFAESKFLWIGNLAMPDLPLLIAYTISMVVFQKIANRMQPMPTDEKQRQQQQMMTWMMPLMFFFFFKNLPSAFILYWLISNLIYFGEQWWFRRYIERQEALVGDRDTPRLPKRSRFMDVMAAAAKRAEEHQNPSSGTVTSGNPKEAASGGKQEPSQRKRRKKRR